MATENDEIVRTAKPNWLILSSVLVIAVLQICLFSAMERFQERKPDFAALYQSGRKIVHERYPRLIDRFPMLNGREYTVELSGGLFPSDSMHPPFEMVIYASLAFLKYRTAYRVWWVCNLTFLLFAAFRLRRHLPSFESRFHYLLILMATFFPVLVAIVQGQNSILLLFLLTFAFDLFQRQKHFSGGVVLAMGMFKFVLVIPFLLWLVLERRWRSVAGFAFGCAALFIESISLVGWSGIASYIKMIAGYGKAAPESAGTESIMPNLRGLVHAVGSGIGHETVLAAISIILSVALLIWVDSRNPKKADLGIRFSLQVILACLVSYHLYPHDAAVLVLPVALLLNESLRRGTQTRFRTAVLFTSICIYVIPFVTHLEVGMPLVCCASLVLLSVALHAPGSSDYSLAMSPG